MLSRKAIAKYNQFRKNTDKSLICHAPFVNLNFEQNGNMTACCYNRKEILGKYPDDTILSAWTGNAAEKLRSTIKKNDLQGGCSLCRELIEAENFSGTKARFYDEYASHSVLPDFIKNKLKKDNSMPRVFELELSNTCNLECVMCSGFFSSSIRKNREKSEPFPFVYDANFVEQLSVFMPTLTDMKFLGGEPFLIDIYYDIWEKIIEVNPNTKVHITTNGTVLNERGKRILEQLNVGIILSVDSINQETYSKIRLGANFDRVMEHLRYFQKITKEKNTYLSIAACPMTMNWQDIPELLSFCNKEEISLHYNVVWNPENLSIKSFSKEKLREIIAIYEKETPTLFQTNTTAIKNRNAYLDLIETIKFWLHEKETNAEATQNQEKIKKWISQTDFSDHEFQDETFLLIISGFVYFNYIEYSSRFTQSLQLSLNLHDYKDFKTWLVTIIRIKGSSAFNKAFLNVLNFLNKQLNDGNTDELFEAKIKLIQNVFPGIDKQQQFVYELTENSVLNQIASIQNMKLENINDAFFERYGRTVLNL